MPGLGHLVHMPSHIDAWVGNGKKQLTVILLQLKDDRYVEITGNESRSTNSTECTTITSLSALCLMDSMKPSKIR